VYVSRASSRISNAAPRASSLEKRVPAPRTIRVPRSTLSVPVTGATRGAVGNAAPCTSPRSIWFWSNHGQGFAALPALSCGPRMNATSGEG
jgi:hypothetical protein